MILATVRTCERRWDSYLELLRNFQALGFPFPLRTFQTSEWESNSAVNSKLTARAALAYGNRHLPDSPQSWCLFLEDDVVLHAELRENLDMLVDWGSREGVDCWYLCNRKTAFQRQFRMEKLVVNELRLPILGSHALLLPKRHLPAILEAHWETSTDTEIFAAIRSPKAKILQVVSPVLVEHRGVYSTFAPQKPMKLEANYANSSNPD